MPMKMASWYCQHLQPKAKTSLNEWRPALQTTNQKVEVVLTPKEKHLIDNLSKQSKVESSELIHMLLFDTGILTSKNEKAFL